MSEDAHSRPSGDAPEPLYDVNIPTPTHAERARTLVAQISTGTLCTLALEPEGYPYGSFVTVAFDEGDPGLPDQRTGRTHQESGAGSSRVPAGRRERRRQIRSPTAASRCSVRARGSMGMPAALEPRSWPRIRMPPTTRTSATSRSGSCACRPFGTSAATDGCPGSARPIGRPPSPIHSRHPRPARLRI